MPHNIQSINYESMSTEQLEAILNCEFHLNEINVPLIQRINKILIEREPEKYSYDVEAAKESFFNDYLNSEPLYEDEEEEGGDYYWDDRITAKTAKCTRHGLGFAKVACIAVITAVLILVGSVTAYAFGYDLWGNIATWTSETFRFKSSGGASQNSGEKEVPEVIQEFKEIAAENGVPDSVLPGWLPSGYSVVEIQRDEIEDRITLYCSLENKTSSYISLKYIFHCDDEYTTEYQKNEGPPEVYEHNGKEYGIMQNMDIYFTVCLDNNIEYSIRGFNSRDELIKVINSI